MEHVCLGAQAFHRVVVQGVVVKQVKRDEARVFGHILSVLVHNLSYFHVLLLSLMLSFLKLGLLKFKVILEDPERVFDPLLYGRVVFV
jgi:hypothetical protein